MLRYFSVGDAAPEHRARWRELNLASGRGGFGREGPESRCRVTDTGWKARHHGFLFFLQLSLRKGGGPPHADFNLLLPILKDRCGTRSYARRKEGKDRRPGLVRFEKLVRRRVCSELVGFPARYSTHQPFAFSSFSHPSLGRNHCEGPPTII